MNASPEPTDQRRLVAQFYRSSRADRKRHCCVISFRYSQSHREKIRRILEKPRNLKVNSSDSHVGQEKSRSQPGNISMHTSEMPPAQTPTRRPAGTAASTASLTGSHNAKTIQEGSASSAGQAVATPPSVKVVKTANKLISPIEDQDICWKKSRIVELTDNLKSELDKNLALRNELEAAHKHVARLKNANDRLKREAAEVQKYRNSIAQIRKSVSGFD